MRAVKPTEAFGYKNNPCKCLTDKEGKGLDSCLENRPCQWAIAVLNLRYCTNPVVMKNSMS